MKKVLDLLKPFASIVFGALITMLYLNGLSVGGNDTIRGVFALLVGGYFIAIGVIGLVAVGKINERVLKLLNGIGISVYAMFFFVITILNLADFNQGYGVNGWIIADFALTVSLGFAALNIVTLFVNNRVLVRIANLVGMLFLLALVFDVLFDVLGNPITLGQINIILVTVHFTFASIYLGNLKE